MFKKLICNLLLNLHPICTARWSHPIYTKSIYKFYLNFWNICLEYRGNVKIPKQYITMHNINDVLIVAASTNNMIVVKWCLLNRANINYRSIHHGYTCLEMASKFGYLEIVKWLLKNKAVVHIQNDKSLGIAAYNDHLEIVKILLENADISILNTALIVVCKYGFLKIIKLLIDKGADIHANNDMVLRTAVGSGYLELVQLLLDNGADIHAHNDNALQRAICDGNLKIIKLLLENGADVHRIDNDVLADAFDSNNSNIIILLEAYL